MATFVSTRQSRGSAAATWNDVLLCGYAPDGGLFVPASVPAIPLETLKTWKNLSHPEICKKILRCYFTEDELPHATFEDTISKAFDSFAHPDVIPIVRAGRAHVAELFHGPTGSFKDVALSVYGKIVENHLETTSSRRRVTILNSTTGDTGSAAIRSVLGGARVRIVVMYPAGKISDIQELQMATVDAPNVKVFHVDGTSDDIDDVVKTLFCDEEFGREQSLGSFSSINVGRLVCQIAHFFYIYLKTCVDVGDEVLVAIPTGGGGHIVTGTIATRMGLPLKFLLATNENDTATRAIEEGRIDLSGDIIPTYACAMDGNLPYNIERLLYFHSNDDAGTIIRKQMSRLETTGDIELEQDQVQSLQSQIWSHSVSQENILETMKRYHADHAYLSCPHTATALCAMDRFLATPAAQKRLFPNGGPLPPIVCLATATPAKFPDVVEKAGLPVPRPESFAKLYHLPKKNRLLERDWVDSLKKAIREFDS